jgi:hypothetical protein
VELRVQAVQELAAAEVTLGITKQVPGLQTEAAVAAAQNETLLQRLAQAVPAL